MRRAGGDVQARYDTAYTQCMYSKGDTVRSAPSGYAAGYGYPGYGYGYGYPGPYYGGYYGYCGNPLWMLSPNAMCW